MGESRRLSWIEDALRLNDQRRKVRYAELRAEGARWMLECRDLWDAEDDDGGVYFSGCANGVEVNAAIAGMDPSSDRLMGVYDLTRPLDEQGPGLTVQQWLAGVRE